MVSDRTALMPLRFLSITGRLTLLYTLSALATLVLATIFLYRMLVSNLQNEDNQFLTGKIYVLRTILRERPDNLEALEEEVKWEGAALQSTKYYARILDEKGGILIETPGMSNILPSHVFPNPFRATQVPEDGTKFVGRNGRSYLVMSAQAEPGGLIGKDQRIQVALDVSQEAALIADYRQKLAIVALLGILFSAGTGVVIARKGITPLRTIASTAKRITATQLHERMCTSKWPKELIMLGSAFDEMLDRLEDSFKRISQFSADLAHELRTPISNLRGEAEVALSRVRTANEYRQVIESSLEEYERLSQMIDGLLFLARAENKDTKIERTIFDAHGEIRALLEFYEPVAEEKKIEMTCHGNASLKADPILFRRAIGNLLSNALRYTPCSGKIDISVVEQDHQSIAVAVSDTGNGIAPEHLPKIFDRFYRADHDHYQNQHGLGLGLAIVKSIMELHGGTVTIQSKPLKGTTVTMVFPLNA